MFSIYFCLFFKNNYIFFWTANKLQEFYYITYQLFAKHKHFVYRVHKQSDCNANIKQLVLYSVFYTQKSYLPTKFNSSAIFTADFKNSIMLSTYYLVFYIFYTILTLQVTTHFIIWSSHKKEKSTRKNKANMQRTNFRPVESVIKQKQNQ